MDIINNQVKTSYDESAMEFIVNAYIREKIDPSVFIDQTYAEVGNKVKKFSSIEEATYWCIIFNGLGSPKKEDIFNKVAAKVRKALQDGKPYLTGTWGMI